MSLVLHCWRSQLLLGLPQHPLTDTLSVPRPVPCYLFLQVWGKVRPVLERLQPKSLPGLVIRGQAKISPTLKPAGHIVRAGVLQGPIPVICGWIQSCGDGKAELEKQPQLP